MPDAVDLIDARCIRRVFRRFLASAERFHADAHDLMDYLDEMDREDLSHQLCAHLTLLEATVGAIKSEGQSSVGLVA